MIAQQKYNTSLLGVPTVRSSHLEPNRCVFSAARLSGSRLPCPGANGSYLRDVFADLAQWKSQT
jgi:hypothetical protein